MLQLDIIVKEYYFIIFSQELTKTDICNFKEILYGRFIE